MWNRLDNLGVILSTLLATSILLLCIVTNGARASDEVRGFHNEHHHGKLHHWYEKLMRPDNPSWSCCNKNDCTPTRAQLVDGVWWALKAGRWIQIPATKINKDDSYDSQAHICWLPSTEKDDSVLCFVIPGIAG